MMQTLVLSLLKRKTSCLQNTLILGAPMSRDVTAGAPPHKTAGGTPVSRGHQGVKDEHSALERTSYGIIK